MANKTSGILARVKAAQEKRADAPMSYNDPSLRITGGDVAASGLGGALQGLLPGALLGAGYGHAKGRTAMGTLRGAGRGALTLGGIGAGGAAGLALAQHANANPIAALGLGLGGAALGGVGGWKGADKIMGERMEEKQGFDPSVQAFAGAVDGMATGGLKHDALNDVGRVGLTALGVGAAGRGIVGLIQAMRANKAKKTRSGPAYLPLPFPASEKLGGWLGDFAAGNNSTSKSGIPWYGPAMLLGGLGGLGLGWKGMDKVIDGQRKKQMDGELEKARSQFHDALLSQYNKPVELHPELMGNAKAAADDTMVKVGQALDALFGKFQAAMDTEVDTPAEKKALDLSNLAGQAAGGYGMYAGLSGLLTGAMVYNKIDKRSRRAVLDAALKKRQRRRFMQQPTEIFAQPEPVAAGGPLEG